MSGGAEPLAAVDPRAAREAAQWLVRLQAGTPSRRDQQAYEAWRASDPAHEIASQRAEMVCRSLGMLPPSAAMRILDRPSRADRRVVVKTLAVLIAGAPLAWVAYRTVPWQEWGASTRTGRGEIRYMTLDDGTQVVLDTDTAIDVVFDGEIRLVRLHAGKIHIDTARDQASLTRPFVVHSAHGGVRALGTRFTVRAGERTQVDVTEGAVEIRPSRARHMASVIQAGYQGSFNDAGALTPVPLPPFADAWSKGVLVADNTPLRAVLDEVGRYRYGVIRCHPSLASMAVSGTYQLKDPERILLLLQNTLPVQIRQRTRLWTSVEPA
nr:FecR family protein [uncultured Duganella sp.]